MIPLSLILILVTVYLLLKYVYSYWSRKGFPYMEPSIPFGNLESVAKRDKSFGMAIYDLHLSTNEKFIGVYLFFRPGLLIRDPEIVRTILTKDFSYFHDRGVYCNEKSDPLSGNLFSLNGTKWKNLRSKLSPSFTSGKLRNMFSTVHDIGKRLENHLRSTLPPDGGIVEMKDLMARYAVDIIASVVFGVDVNCIQNAEDDFIQIGHIINSRAFIPNLKNAAVFLCPKLLEALNIKSIDKRVRNFMINIVQKTIDYRETEGVHRKDLMQLLLQLRNTGKINEDGAWDVKSVSDGLKSMSIELCAAQIYVFYLAGFESTASTIAYCLYELTQNEELMKNIQNDIQNTLDKHDGKVTYDSIQDMKYLDLCVKGKKTKYYQALNLFEITIETIRKYPVLPLLNRECTRQYQIPGTKYIIEKGTPIVMSLLGIHRDPTYFPNPLKFEPERFAEGMRNYDENAYFPFGEGPRACIALRLGVMNVKVGIVSMLNNFTIRASQKRELEFDNFSVVLMPKGGVHVKIQSK